MKRSGIRGVVIIILVVGAFLFSKTANADTTYQSNFTNDASDLCGFGKFDNQCGAPGGVQTISAWQDLLILPSSADPQITITGFDIGCYLAGGSGNANTKITGYLLDDDDWTKFVSESHGEVKQSRATSTTDVLTCEGKNVGSNATVLNGDYGTVHLQFQTPYTIQTGHTAKALVIRITSAGGFINGSPVLKEVDDSYPGPEFTSFSQFWSGGGHSDTGDNDYFQNSRDLAIRIFRSSAETQNMLTIQVPDRGSIQSTNFPFGGTCPTGETVHYGITSCVTFGSCTATDTPEIYSTASCSNNVWSTTISTTQMNSVLDFKQWYAYATTTLQRAANMFFFGTPPTEPNPGQINIIHSCEIPFLSWDPCVQLQDFINASKAAVQNTITGTFTLVQNTKPYAYIFQIYGVLHSSLASTTASSSLPMLQLDTSNGHGTITFFDGRHIIPKDKTFVFSSQRNLEKFIIHLSFFSYLIYSFIL